MMPMRNKINQWKFPEEIVSCEWLKERLTDKTIRLYDCTAYLHYTDDHPSKPYDVVSGLENYKKKHIPTAAFLDLQEELSEQKSPYSFTLPDYHELASRFMKLGVGDPFHIILYSRNGVQWATRVWWMLFILGFKRVSILDGGIKDWEALGYEIETSVTSYSHAKFEENIDKSVFVDKDVTLGAMNKSDCTLLNALTSDIHKGENPRYGRPGRIPGSLNIPFHELVDSKTGKLVSPEKAIKVFSQENISSDDNILNYCGGGIAATLNAFIQRQLGFKNMQIYDNSMSEWAMDNTLPIETD